MVPDMTRLLLASMPAHGHVAPLVPLAKALRARGHEVFWFTGPAYRERVEAAGAHYCPMIDCWDLDAGNLDAAFPGRAETKGLARFRFDLREIFIAQVPGQVADLERHIAQIQPDALIAEPSIAAACSVVHARTGLPWATMGITALTMPSADTAPFGFGVTPMAGRIGRLRNRAMQAAIDRTLFRAIDADYRAMAARLGIEPHAGGIFGSTLSPYLYLQPTVPAFEYPRGDLAPQVHFVGPHLPDAPPAATLPAWWGAMLEDDRPVVLVTQGTVATDATELVLPTIEALRDAPVQVIGTTGGPDPADVLRGAELPANARLERFVPFDALMPHVKAYVSNGGYGGLHFALAHGVPMVVAGKTEDKAELVARTSWSGVGIGLRRQRVSPAQIGRAVRRVLDEPRFRARAGALQAEMAAAPGPARSAELVEALVATRAPVVRDAYAPAGPAEATAVADAALPFGVSV